MAPWLDPRFLALTAQMRRHLLVDVLEHRLDAEMRSGIERAEFLRLAVGVAHFGDQLGLGLLVALLGPFAELNQMLRQPVDRVAERPGARLVFRAVAGGV